MVTSASSVVSQKMHESSLFFFKNQLLLGIGLGGLGFLITSQVNYRIWKKFALPVLGLALVALSLIFVPELSYSYGGATRWVDLGPISFQPSEIAKLALIIYLAAWIENRRDNIDSPWEGLVPFLVIVGAVGMLILLQPDISTLLILIATAGVMFLAAGGKFKHLLLFAILTGVVAGTAIAFSPARLERFETFANPSEDPRGSAYQINQSLIAIGSGGLWGKGIGGSTQKYFYLPEPAGDSIFAIIGEETGFIGTSAVLLIYLVFGGIGFLIGIRSQDDFGRLIAFGFTSLVVIQAFINMSAVTGLTPTTGVVLPFISYGGTAMAIFLVGAGLVYNIAKSNEE